MNIRKVIRESLNQLLFEVRVFRPDVRAFKSEEPLKDTDTIRVYHGFHKFEEAIIAAKFGISGKQRAKRIYSYESNNNPYGLFVTLDFDKAKEFAYPRDGHKVIFEINAKVSDLEAPVWPSGQYVVQGQMAQFWDNEEDRHQRGTIAAREKASKDDLDFVSKSDRPEVAYTLVYLENQALFTGDLNPNMINSIWYGKSEKGHGYNPSQLTKMSRLQFLKQFDTHEPERDVMGNFTPAGDDYYNKQNRIFKPNDNFDEEKFLQGIINKEWAETPEEAKRVVQKVIKKDSHYIEQLMWPKQVTQAKQQGFFDN